jgi:hypothetical protein
LALAFGNHHGPAWQEWHLKSINSYFGVICDEGAQIAKIGSTGRVEITVNTPNVFSAVLSQGLRKMASGILPDCSEMTLQVFSMASTMLDSFGVEMPS